VLVGMADMSMLCDMVMKSFSLLVHSARSLAPRSRATGVGIVAETTVAETAVMAIALNCILK
jgi:hypothetical protein